MHRVLKTDGPTGHVELVRGAGADGIRAVVDEHPDDRQIAALGREVNRIRVVAFIPDIRIGAALQQRLDEGFVPDGEV